MGQLRLVSLALTVSTIPLQIKNICFDMVLWTSGFHAWCHTPASIRFSAEAIDLLYQSDKFCSFSWCIQPIFMVYSYNMMCIVKCGSYLIFSMAAQVFVKWCWLIGWIPSQYLPEEILQSMTTDVTQPLKGCTWIPVVSPYTTKWLKNAQVKIFWSLDLLLSGMSNYTENHCTLRTLHLCCLFHVAATASSNSKLCLAVAVFQL